MEIPSIFLNRILIEAAKKNASNLHLTVGSAPMMRINDKLVPMEGEDLIVGDLMEKLIDVFTTEEERKKIKEEKEIILVKTFAGNFRFRINIFYQKDMPALSFRSIPNNIKGITDLNLPKFLNNLTKIDSGLFIVAGPQLSGRTTTAMAIVEEVNKNCAKRVVTIEDPIEWMFVSKKSIVEQRQVGRDVKSVTAGIQYCLDEDADLVYISEIKREFELVIESIMELAAGNSLVILEINSDSVIRVTEKILDALRERMPVESARYTLADMLVGVMVQKLLPRSGGGMVMANEILLVNSAVKSLIREGRIYQFESVMQTSRKEGMISMEKSIEELIKTGEVKPEDINIKLTNS